MSLFSFSKKKILENHSLVFNIGSGSVTGAIINFTEKPGVEIASYFEEKILFQKEVTPETHLELMKKSLSSLLEKFQKKGLKIDNVFYVFSSPWSISQTKTIKIKENKAFKLTEDYLKKIISTQADKAEILNHGQIIEKKITQIKANGYVVDGPNGKLIKELEVSLFLTAIPDQILKEIEDVVVKYFVVKNTICHSVSLSIFSVIRDLFPNKEDFIYLDISEEMTDLAIVKDNVVTVNVSFPLGRNEFIRRLSQKLNLTELIADSMIKMNSSKSHHEMANLNFNNAMKEVVEDWANQLQSIFAKIKQNLHLPTSVFFVANNDLTFLLKERLKAETFDVTLLEARKISSPIKIENTIFKIVLMFLDKIYKI